MSTAIGYALLGIGAGAIYALLGQGIVLIYRGSGVLNLAQGAFAMIGAYLYLELHAPGSFGFGTFSTQSGWPVLPSFVVAVAATAALGLATDQLLLRRMRQASPLARLIATVGVLLVLQSAALKVWGDNPPFVAQILPSRIWHLSSSITLPSGYVWLLVHRGGVDRDPDDPVALHQDRLGDVRGVGQSAGRGGGGHLAGVRLVGDVGGGLGPCGGGRDPVHADHAGVTGRGEPARDSGARGRPVRGLLVVSGDAG